MAATEPVPTREVLVSEFQAAGEDGLKLLELANKLNVVIRTARNEYLDLAKAGQEHPYTSADIVWFGGPATVRMYHGDMSISGVTGNSRESVPQALKELFKIVSQPGTVLESKLPETQKTVTLAPARMYGR